MRLRRLPSAIRDVDEIWDWIAADDLAAAERLLDRISLATQRLSDFPESGRKRPELGPDARSIPVGHYVVLYRVRPHTVEIVRVVHGSRDLRGMFELRGED